MVHVLDDFLLIEQSKSLAVVKFVQFIDLCQQIGVPLSAEKTVFPPQLLIFLGIQKPIMQKHRSAVGVL
jgi:hypothetical protein